MKFGDIELKGIKTAPDHEGIDMHFGNIYFKNKKVGTFSEDYMCGPLHVDFLNKDIEASVCDAAKKTLASLGFLSADKKFSLDPMEAVVYITLETVFWNKKAKNVQKKFPSHHCGVLIAYNRVDFDKFYSYRILDEGCFVEVGKDNSIAMAKKKLPKADLFVIVTADAILAV